MYSKAVALVFVSACVLSLNNSLAKECNRETLTQCLYEMEAGMNMITAEHEVFKQLNSRYNWRKQLDPSAFLVAQRVYDVQIGVKCLKKFRCPFTIKSGGNRFETESFGRNPYYALDLSNMTKIEVYKKTMRAVIGTGALVSDLSSHLFRKHSVALIGGVFPKSSFGGQALNGGWSTIARKYGLTSQNVLEMTVVNADGEVMTVSPVENKPLFFALRGAGQGNYGVVTDYTVKLFDVPKEVSVLRVTFNFADFREVFEKWQTYANKFDESVTSVLIVGKNSIDLYSTVVNEDKNLRIRLTNKVLTHFTIYGAKANIMNMNFNDMNELFYNMFNQYKIRGSKSNFIDKSLNSHQIEKLHLSLNTLFEKYPDALNINYEFGGKIESAFEDSAFIHTHHSYLFQVVVNDVLTDETVVDVNVLPNEEGKWNEVKNTKETSEGKWNEVKKESSGFVFRTTPVDVPVNSDAVDPNIKLGAENLKFDTVGTFEPIGPIKPAVKVEIVDNDRVEAVRIKKTIEVLDAENNVVKQKTVVVEEELSKVVEHFDDKPEPQNSKAIELITAIKHSLRSFFEEISFMDSGHSYQYFGDHDADITRYYGEYSNALQRIKCIYDHENVFKHSQSIPLKCGQSHAYRLEL